MSRQITAMFYVEGDTDRAAYENFCTALDRLGDAPVAARDFLTIAIEDDAAAERAMSAPRDPRLVAVWREMEDDRHAGDSE